MEYSYFLKLTKVAHLLVVIMLGVLSCKNKYLENVTIHDNPFVSAISKPIILLDHLNNPAAPVYIGNRAIFAESGRGTIFEYKGGKKVPLIEGFGLDNYAGYQISVLGMTHVPDKRKWIVAASQDDGHIFVFDETTFPTKADKGLEIKLEHTEPANPFGVILADLGKTLVASGGTKSVYQGQLEVTNPIPLKPVFDVSTGIAGLALAPQSGNIFGAVIGSGENNGALITWTPSADSITVKTIADGFTNLIGVLALPNGMLLLLEFGGFEAPHSGRVLIIDPEKPNTRTPLISGLDAPSGFALSPDNMLLISTFGKDRNNADGMLIALDLIFKK